jgi:phosphoribosylformylglycinamidine synthase
VALLGGFGATDERRFGSSQYAKTILNQLWGLPPQLDMHYEKRVHDAMREIAKEGLAESAHDLSDGGLAVALAEASSGTLGAKVEVPLSAQPEDQPEISLFGESPSRILISTGNPERVREIAMKHNVLCAIIGATMKERLQIGNGREMLIDLSTTDLKHSFEETLPQLLQTTNAG